MSETPIIVLTLATVNNAAFTFFGRDILVLGSEKQVLRISHMNLCYGDRSYEQTPKDEDRSTLNINGRRDEEAQGLSQGVKDQILDPPSTAVLTSLSNLLFSHKSPLYRDMLCISQAHPSPSLLQLLYQSPPPH
ncbi:hypothetical protein VNO77_32794 [Canavalia gladiata]|uniref:Uncharacterized protein n=1 Tax=Canavalia gladiata TaxID=3824 RepID=A0AAN9KS49_CANGL